MTCRKNLATNVVCGTYIYYNMYHIDTQNIACNYCYDNDSEYRTNYECYSVFMNHYQCETYRIRFVLVRVYFQVFGLIIQDITICEIKQLRND